MDKKDGFIHMSAANQIRRTLELHFSMTKTVYIIGFDTTRMEKLLWEKSRKGDLFPHLYGKLHIKDMCCKIFLQRNNGQFSIPNYFFS